MKIFKLTFLIVSFFFMFKNVNAQDGNYSILIIKQISELKGMKFTFKYEIIHYQGNGQEVDMTKDKSNIDINTIVDVLNTLSKQGWKVVGMYTFNDLKQEDIKVGMSRPMNTIYYQYTLSKI